MTVQELYNKLEWLIKYHPNDEVCVIIEKNTMGGTSTSKVKHVNSGFDWDHGKLLIKCENKLYIKD